MKIKITHTNQQNKETVLFEGEWPDDDDYVMVDIERDDTVFSISPNWEGGGKDGIEVFRVDQDYIVEIPSDDLVSLRHA
jgi:hypothetical protein